MPNTTAIAIPVKGMLSDLHNLNSSPENYSFALNAVVSDRFEGNEFLLQNEMSNVCSVAFPPGYQVVGFKEIPEQKRVLYMLKNPLTGGNQIGEVLNCIYPQTTDRVEKVYCTNCPDYVGKEKPTFEDKTETCYCQYRLIVSDPCLNFDIHHPVDIEYKITNCSLNIYFTDDLNERRFLYFDYEDNDPTKPLVLQDRFKVAILDEEECTCPEGYTLSGTNCIQQVTTPIIPSGDQRVACAASGNSYTQDGVALYDPGYNLNGTGSSTVIHTADTYWSNPATNTTDGVLNRVALWPCDSLGSPQGNPMQPMFEPVGFIFPLVVPTTKTYYIGIAGDNTARIRVDCETIVELDPNALAIQYGTSNVAAFTFWHIYPVTLTAGRHVIELTGINWSTIAGFGAEVYDNTAAEILSATGGAGLNILFSTEDMAGQPLQISSSFSGTCPSGDCIDIDEDDNLICVVTSTIPAECDSCLATTYLDELDCEKIKYHPNNEHPCIEFIDFVNGGNLAAGTYQVLIAYADTFGNPITEYYPSSQIAPLFRDYIAFETNYTTGKALSFKIHNLRNDGFHQYYNLVIAKTVDNFTEFILVGTFNTTQVKYTYTGFEKAPRRLSAPEVLFKRPYYQKAKGVTTANNYLFFTGAKEYPVLNLQPVANKIKLEWQTVAIKEGAYFDPRNTFYFRSNMRDEVYPYGVVFEMTNGRETCAFHIPGRAALPSDLEIIDNADIITENDCEFIESGTIRNQRWQVYNTASITGDPHEYNENCEIDKCWEFGEFAYWESTERYPNVPEVWGELCGRPIRHHKFPDNCVTHIHDGLGGSKVFKDSNYIFPIGVRVDPVQVAALLNQAVLDGLITQADRDDIIGFRIVRGNRVGNKSIDAKGLIFNMWNYVRDSETYHYANYPYNDLNPDDFLAPDDSTYDGSTTSPPTPSSYDGSNNRFTFHSPDIHFVNAELGDILKIETEEYGESEGYFTLSECQGRHKMLSTAARAIALGFGVAAALSATGEKECKTIVEKSERHWTLLASPGAVGPVPFAVQGDLSLASPVTALGYQSDTGLPIIPNPLAAESTQTTCRGQSFQLVNTNLIVNAILLFGGAGAGAIIQRTILGLIEAEKVLDTLKLLTPFKNYSTQYNSVGRYNNYLCSPEGNKVRFLQKTAYLEPMIQNVDEPSADPSQPFTTIKINNWQRERSVYLKIPDDNPLLPPSIVDNSRFTMDQAGLNDDQLDVRVYRNISSYYASIKRLVLDQYGQICNIEYLETNGCSFKFNQVYNQCERGVFGGDTFINRFALKRKLPFFIHTMCGVGDGYDVKYSDLGNVAYPNYYFNTEEPLFERMSDLSIDFGNIGATLQDIVGTNETRLDAKTSKFFYQNGYAHLFSYGIPYFFVESDINVDYRHGQDNKAKDFYPHNTDLKQWFEEENVPISEDNYYFYNRTYSKQNHESEICTSCILDIKQLTCQNPTDNLLIYSEPTDTEVDNDNWLVFKANNFELFPLRLGNLITADGIESDKVLVRFTKGTQIFNAYNEIVATGENIQVGTGGMFKTRPRDIAVTDLGYAGTMHRDIVHTEFGHIWADAERGEIFNLGNGGQLADELTKEGQSAWFKENLPFQIKKDFPEIELADLDNNLNGIGLHYCFDKRFKRFLITKLDYKKINPDVQYDKATKSFYILDEDEEQVPVKLKDPRYFCNKGWTVSYHFLRKAWISYHSYKPNFYVEMVDGFDSAFTRINDQKLYTHNVTNKSYQVFYGRLEPFIVELQTKPSPVNSFITSIEYTLDVIRYHNEYDTFYNRTKAFNKAIVYTKNGTSGLLHLKVSDPENMAESIEYPKRIIGGYEVLHTNSENIWKFNDFFDVAKSQTNNLPIFNYDCNNVNKQLNPKALNYDKDEFDRAVLRGEFAKVRLINDAESNYKFIVKIGQINQQQSFR